MRYRIRVLQHTIGSVAPGTINGPLPPDPNYFEVHIYKDGHVEVAVTARISAPQLEWPVDERAAGQA